MAVKTRLREVLMMVLIVLAGVLVLSLFWEFFLEDQLVPQIYEYYHPEPMYERVEYIIVALVLSAIALIVPAMMTFRHMQEADRAKEALSRAYDDLEQRVQDRTRVLVDTNKELEGAISERLQSEAALRESEKELRLLSAQLLTAQEKERSRVALDLHDNVTQSLVAMKFRIEHALDKPADSTVNPAEMSSVLVPVIQETIEEVRNIYMRLRPSMLDDLGLSAALVWLRNDFRNRSPDIHVQYDIEIKDDEVAGEAKTVIYRVVQEALENVVRHSKADLVNVSLKRIDNNAELTVQDNGTGFRLEDVLSVNDSLRGMGLSSMRERIELIGGKLNVTSGEGKGTTIQAAVPLYNSSHHASVT